MAQFQDKLTEQRGYTTQLLNQLTTDYQALKPEIKQISEQYAGSDEEFSFSEEFELLIVNIFGYAQQLRDMGNVKQLESTIAHLQQLQVFANSTIAQFYMESRGQYPKVQFYLQMLDYLRLLTLEYLQMQQTMQPISA